MDLTHASFFSGVGGLDLGLERAGWRTVSFSEIDPYACAVLARHWPGVPNLGDIGRLADSEYDGLSGRPRDPVQRDEPSDIGGDGEQWRTRGPIPDATLWTGGFPCQDLSIAGKRRGLAGERSGLAFAFLDLVERHRPRCVLLENVPGLLSSHGGRDLGTLLGRLGDAGYGWAFRVLDAQWFRVPQRRRRVFILALDLERHPDEFSAAEVLAVGTRCGRDHPQEREAWANAAGGVDGGVVRTHNLHDAERGDVWWSRVPGSLQAIGSTPNQFDAVVDRPPSDPDGMRAPDGLAGRLDGGGGVAATLNSGGNAGGFRTEPGEHLVVGKVSRSRGPDGDGERWDSVEVASTRNTFDTGDIRAVELVMQMPTPALDLDPLGLDSNRYRCIGNGVAAPVAEWLGWRLRRYLEDAP